MQTMTLPARNINLALWSSRLLGALVVLFLAFDSMMKLIQHPEAVTATTALGYPAEVIGTLGFLQLAALLFYLIPRTSVLGAILVTGYLGGAVATQVRVGADPFALVFPVILGTMLWGALYLRDERLRALLPLRANG